MFIYGCMQMNYNLLNVLVAIEISYEVGHYSVGEIRTKSLFQLLGTQSKITKQALLRF